MDRQNSPFVRRFSVASVAPTTLLGFCLAAAVVMMVYLGLRSGVVPRLPLPVLLLVFPLSALSGTLFVKWRHPAMNKFGLAAYFVVVLMVVFLATWWILQPDF